ncbi:hypothetical protein NZ47_02835 [Anaerovibrio lipolyticus]|uniref:Response regulatory domain-containing protein n=1 Tax=Anaerovibrio lipolyticus TaxID=82374 RepID=A0A0B2K1N2_9FIRM|nr:SpoIIE family protein phosphatase [Anaerovibrio lipolyticus]KHM52788.1 hypothetical protein NZ47_02835 [Anaerovibrio lipolyticus]
MSNMVLVVSSHSQEVAKICTEAMERYDNKFILEIVNTGIEALNKIAANDPMLLIIDNDLPDIPGMSIASIVKDASKLHNPTVFLYNLTKLYPNTKADNYFFKPLETDVFSTILFEYLDFKFNDVLSRGSIANAVVDQDSRIPRLIATDTFSVNNIYSPYHLLSGDGLHYWYDTESNSLYGYLFDCVGHDINSYILAAFKIVPMIEKSFKSYESGVYDSLSEFMASLNEYIFALNSSPEPTPMLLFFVDLNARRLTFCSAGIPNILIKRKGTMEVIDCNNYILGFKPDAEFNEECMLVNDASQIIFGSDGFLDLLRDGTTDICEIVNSAKHDDVSAIIINFNDAHNGHPGKV